jgi:hypothetical protein
MRPMAGRTYFGYTINWAALLATIVPFAALIGGLFLAAQCVSEVDHFRFGQGVEEAEREEMRRAAKDFEAWLESDERGLILDQYTVFAEDNIDRLTGLYAQAVEDFEIADAANLRQFLFSGGAVAAGPRVFIFAGPEWSRASQVERRLLVAHELFHAYQYQLIAANNFVSGAALDPLPDWLIEGSAEWGAAHAVSAAGGVSYDVLLGLSRDRSRNTAASLVEIEQESPVHGLGDAAPYATGMVAVDMLVRNSSELSVFVFWARVGRLGDWRQAFSDAFGETVPEFYARFEAERASSFAQYRGGIEGSVETAAGGSVWGASVEACAQGRCFRTFSGKNGRYRLALPDGTYTVSAIGAAADGVGRPAVFQVETGESVSVTAKVSGAFAAPIRSVIK